MPPVVKKPQTVLDKTPETVPGKKPQTVPGMDKKPQVAMSGARLWMRWAGYEARFEPWLTCASYECQNIMTQRSKKHDR
eukprot:1099795-Amphidinium_carterae.1